MRSGWNVCTADYTSQLQGSALVLLLRFEAVMCAGLFVWGCKQMYSLFQVCFCPVKRGHRAGSSRNVFDYSRRVTQTRFPHLYYCRCCKNFGLLIAHFSIFLQKEKSWYNRAPFLINCTTQWKNDLLWNPRDWEAEPGLRTFPRVVRVIPTRPGSISSLYGAKTNLKEKTYLFAA